MRCSFWRVPEGLFPGDKDCLRDTKCFGRIARSRVENAGVVCVTAEALIASQRALLNEGIRLLEWGCARTQSSRAIEGPSTTMIAIEEQVR